MLRCPRLPAAAAASTIRALASRVRPGAVCPALSSVLQLPRRPGAGPPAGIQPHPSLAGLSLRALSLSATPARPGTTSESGEPQPEYDSDKLPAPLLARVVGEHITIGNNFLGTFQRDGFVVDKTLVCKALLESPDKAVRICLPRHFGKTFNLSIIAQFFNPVTVNDCLSDTENPDLDATRDRRRQLLRGSLLDQHHPDFVEKHFAAIPVIHITFRDTSGKSLGLFYKWIARAIYRAATFWINAYAAPELLKDCARAKYEALQRTYSRTGTSLRKENASKWEERGGLASVLFKELSEFLVAQHGDKYIILVDEYDQPLDVALGKKWQAEADDAYLGLLMDMFKDNDHLAKGLLVGAQEFGLSSRESGLSSAKELSLTTGRYRRGDAESADIDDKSPGPLAALFAFTREDVAELTKRAREVSEVARSHSQEDITNAIDTWYGGYDFGFPTKRYCPWSVLKFLEKLAHGDTIKKAAAPHWFESDSMPGVAWQLRVRCYVVLKLAVVLLDDYRAKASGGSIRVADLGSKAEWELPDRDLQKVNIGRTTYARNGHSLHGAGELATLLLHLGCLTMGPGNILRIPNDEMRCMWEDAITNAKAMCAIETRYESGVSREQLVNQLYGGEIAGISACLWRGIKIIDYQPDMERPERLYADMLRFYLHRVLVSDPGPDATMIEEPKGEEGRPDIVLMLNPKRSYHDPLVVVIKAKYVPDSVAKTPDIAMAKGKELALKALNEIVEKRYAWDHHAWPLRLDIGIAVGRGRVMVTCTRWWAWSPSQADRHYHPSIITSRRKGEKVKDWMQRVAEADKTRWRDGLGWVRTPSPAELRRD